MFILTHNSSHFVVVFYNNALFQFDQIPDQWSVRPISRSRYIHIIIALT